MNLRRLITLAGLSVVLVMLTGSFSVAQAHPSCASNSVSVDPDYTPTFLGPRPTHIHQDPHELWRVDGPASSYGGPGAELIYRVSEAASWWSPWPWKDPYKSVKVWCPNFSG